MYNRVWLIAIGTVIWGSMSTGMGFSTNYAEVPTRLGMLSSDAVVTFKGQHQCSWHQCSWCIFLSDVT